VSAFREQRDHGSLLQDTGRVALIIKGKIARESRLHCWAHSDILRSATLHYVTNATPEL
jgi:hypothetical protein